MTRRTKKSEAGAALAALRKRTTVTCTYCGKRAKGKYTSARYCSDKCRYDAANARRKARLTKERE